MDLRAALFKVLMGLPAHTTDHESVLEREARMHVVADSIYLATDRAACATAPEPCKPIFSDRRTLAALLIAKGEKESGFALYVHSGHCQDGPVGARCDSDRFGHERAHSPWQLWKVAVYPSSDWDRIQGTDEEATELAAWHAAKRLAGGRATCRSHYPGDELAAAIAGFAGSCLIMRPARVRAQAALARRILNQLPAW